MAAKCTLSAAKNQLLFRQVVIFSAPDLAQKHWKSISLNFRRFQFQDPIHHPLNSAISRESALICDCIQHDCVQGTLKLPNASKYIKFEETRFGFLSQEVFLWQNKSKVFFIEKNIYSYIFMCMCIYMCVCIYTCTYTHIYIHTHT